MRVTIVGGGAAGLLAALMLARADHEVVVCDHDGLVVAPNVEAAAADAFRPSAPQTVQPHIVMSRCRLVLEERLPDVLHALIAAGAVDVPLSARVPAGLDDFAPQPGDEQFGTVMTRRSTFDWVLRRAAREQRGIVFKPVRVTGLCAAPASLHVTGVRTEDGEIAADVVVDASGRRSPVDSWLDDLGAPPAARWSADCGVTYIGRHYRIRAGSELPGPNTTRVVVPFDDFTAVLFCSDNDTVQTALAPLSADRRFRRLADPEVYDAALAAVPTHAAWMRVLEPISPVHQMVAPQNTLRRLVNDGTPVITGLLPVGDAVCTTNPTFGRGLSLGAWGAADLVDVLTEHPDDPARQSVALDERIADHVAPYYGDQAKVDSARLAMMRHSVFDSPLPFPSAQDTELTFPALRAAAMVNETAFRAFWALMGMLRRPDDVYSDPALAAAVDQARDAGTFGEISQPDLQSLFATLKS